MNQKNIAVSVVLLLALGVVIIISNNSKDLEIDDADSMMQKKEVSMVKEDEAVMEKKEVATKETSMMKSGSYEAYDMTKLTKAETGDVVLFFRASWCPTCRGLDKDIRANLGNIPENLTILDVDYDNSNELKKKYGVTYQHTMVQVDKDGNMIKKWMGSPNLTSFIKEVI